MVQNILALLKDQLDDNLIGKIAGFLGENKSGVTSAVSSALPALLLGLMKKGSEPGGAEGLMKILQEGKHDSGILDNIGSVLDGGSATTNLLSSGKNLLGSIFGDKAGGIGDLIASASGMSKKSGSSLLGMLAPIVMGFLGKTLKSQGGFNTSGLTSLLLGQKDFIKSALPSGLTNLLGVSNLDDLGRKAMPGGPGPQKKTWLWIILLIIALLLLWLWRSCSTQKVEETVSTVEGQVSETWSALGNFFAKKLPNGVELNIPELGVENKLIAFIEDADRPVDDKTWFTFDRLTFDTGTATLKPESQEQLKNIAEIMKAYPNVAIKLGGYTDNTGDPNANLTLSQQRADSVMAELVKLGVDAIRMEAEGYGQEHPVADNSTEEGRAKNRRIDLRVTSK